MTNIIECPALQKLINSKRMPALFIGSGISRRYLENYPQWDELLNLLRKQIGITEIAYSAKKNKIKISDPSITESELNQSLADYLRDTFLNKIETNKIDVFSLFTEEEINNCINGTDYFKMLIAKNISTYKIKEDMKNELDLFRSISSKISTVFTTNYDLFLQQEVFNSFKVYEEQNKYYFRESTGYGELYKIHGCVTKPNHMIICKNDYKNFNDNLKIVSSKLLNTLLDFPLIFMGYSLEDENIKQILSDFINSFDYEIIQDVKKYIILVEYTKGQDKLIQGEKQFTSINGKSIIVTTIKTDNYSAIYNYINEITPSASAYELRKYSAMVAQIIQKASKGEKTIYATDIKDVENNAMAIYIGTQDTVKNFTKSTIIYTNNEILKKALFNEKIDFDSFAQNWFESKSISSTTYSGCFYIKKHMTLDKGSIKFEKNLFSRKSYFDKEFTPQKKYKVTYNQLLNEIEKLDRDTIQIYNLIKISQKAMSSLYYNTIITKEFRYVLQHLYNVDNNIINESEFRKAICYLTYREYKK